MWIDVVGFPDYKVNNKGIIKSFKRYKEGKIMSPYTDKDGYLCVSLRVNGKSKAEKVHRAVAKAYLINENNYKQVNHKNGIKKNNSISNLEWCTNQENQRHAWDSDLRTVKLKVSDVIEIKRRIKLKESNTSIAKLFKIDISSISNIKTGKTWNTISETDK